jgi:hypothetical protein
MQISGPGVASCHSWFYRRLLSAFIAVGVAERFDLVLRCSPWAGEYVS